MTPAVKKPCGACGAGSACQGALHRSRRLCHTEGVAQQWYEVTVEVAREHHEAIANFLIESGAPGLQMEDARDTVTLTAYFCAPPPIESLRRFCADIGCGPADHAAARIHTGIVADKDWAENWKLSFRPQLVGERLYVCPSWDCTPPPGRLAVIIDPGMAFGTGQHATTRGSLQLLEAACRERRIARAVDVGTGSGVLAIALAKLGVTAVWAIDIDPTARQTAAANARRNRVDAAVHVVSHWNEIDGIFDLVVANLFANLLVELAPRLSRTVCAGGTLICSGLLRDDERRVRAACAGCGFVFRTRLAEDSWVTLAFTREGAR